MTKDVLHQLLLPYKNCNRPWYLAYVAWKDNTWNGRSRKRIKEEYWQIN